MEAKYGPRTKACIIRLRRTPRYDVSTLLMTGALKGICRSIREQERMSVLAIAPRFDVKTLSNKSSTTECVSEKVFRQYGINEGLKLFGENGAEAIRQKLLQVYNRRVLMPREP